MVGAVVPVGHGSGGARRDQRRHHLQDGALRGPRQGQQIPRQGGVSILADGGEGRWCWRLPWDHLWAMPGEFFREDYLEFFLGGDTCDWVGGLLRDLRGLPGDFEEVEGVTWGILGGC